jgi:hypothetical protein
MRFAILCCLSLLFLIGCQASFDEKSEEAVAAVEDQLKAAPKETNKKLQEIEFYLPFGFEIEKESPNNIILKNGSKTYILFYNPNENQQSDVVYKSTLNQHDKLEVNEKWQEEDQFVYFLVEELEKDQNELIVGIGGVKLTSEVKTNSLATEAAQMIEIIKSVSVLVQEK